MKPYYEHAGITIFHGDCREVLPTIPKVDLVLTDPPFGTGAMTGGYGRAQNYGGEGRRIAGDNDLQTATAGLQLAWNLIIDGYLVAFCAPRRMHEALIILPNANFFGELIWDKMAPGLGYTIRYAHESALVWKKGELPTPDRACLSVVHSCVDRANIHERHPHQKPLDFWLNAMRLAPGIVLDPFMGSGTTLRAAKDLGRRAIGIEIEEKYCEIAARRLQQEVLL